MNPVIENLLTRRSVREFDAKPIDEAILSAIMKAGAYAPSGMNRQTWKFTAIVNKEKIQTLAVCVGKILGRENYCFYNPAALIIPSNERDSIWGKEDNACALENIFLAAHAYGIGSVWINQLQGICDQPEIRNLLRSFEIPDSHLVYGLAAIGYPKNPPVQKVSKTAQLHIVR